MTRSGKPNLEDRTDRYVRRELSPEEARELAQASLDSPDLFEELTYSALAKSALSTAVPSPNVVRFPHRVRLIAAGAAAVAAAVVLLSLYSLKPPRGTEKPALLSTAKPGQPVLLASGLQAAAEEGAPVFRGPSPDSRAPQPLGSIVSMEDGQASVNLGSLDGLANGSELQIVRDSRPIGRLAVTTVFRERARGRILADQPVRVNDQVRVAGAAHLDALLEQVEALGARGDPGGARSLAEKTVQWAETADVTPAKKGSAYAQLAGLEYRGGLLEAAETHLRLAAVSLPPGEQPATWNNLAVLEMLRGDYPAAEAPLTRAISASPKSDLAYARSANNLGVLAELRGDRRKAEAFYADALRTFAAVAGAPALERQAVEANLARSKGLH